MIQNKIKKNSALCDFIAKQDSKMTVYGASSSYRFRHSLYLGLEYLLNDVKCLSGNLLENIFKVSTNFYVEYYVSLCRNYRPTKPISLTILIPLVECRNKTDLI